MQKGPDRFGSKFQEILILLPNLNVSKRPYPCHALGRSVCLGQGWGRASQALVTGTNRWENFTEDMILEHIWNLVLCNNFVSFYVVFCWPFTIYNINLQGMLSLFILL